MKKIYYLALMALVAVVFSSCEKKQTEPKFLLSDLQGRWIEDGTKHYVNFTDESAAEYEAGYLWGYEWDETDPDMAVYEVDVLADYHQNGWFAYKLNKDELLEIHKMGQNWADIPKIYTMVTLTSSKMTYHLKDYKNEKVSFTKQ